MISLASTHKKLQRRLTFVLVALSARLRPCAGPARAVALTVGQLASVALVGSGLYMLAPWLGVTAGGAALGVVCFALDQPRAQR